MVLATERLTPAIGATVLDPRVLAALVEGDDPPTVDAVHAALMEHQLLVFPGAALTPAAMVRLGRALGPLPAPHHSYVTLPDNPDVVVLEWGGERKPDAAEWHADMTYRANPPFASLLQAQAVPPVGGDTLWASMYAVHDALSAGLRTELEQMSAVHDLGAFRSSSWLDGGQQALDEAIARTGVAVHPIIARHPFTGRPYLNVSESFTRWVIGASAPESARLLTMLFDMINRPEFHARLRWRPGTLAIWDNRGTQHYAVADYLPLHRMMWRVAVADDARQP